MSTALANPSTRDSAAPHRTAQRIAVIRAALALLWAATVVIAIGDRVPRTDSAVPLLAAALLTTYPLIDVVSSLLAAGGLATARVNAALGTLGVIAIGATSLGLDAGAALVAFGAWAAISGAIQLGVAVQHRREGRQLPMVISGGLSTVAGLSFIAAAGKTDADLLVLGGYMALGAVLYLIWAYRTPTTR